MSKLRPEDLDKIAQSMRNAMFLREGTHHAKITVHMGTCGIAAGARKIMIALLQHIDESAVKDVLLTTSGCAGLCSHEPMMTVELAGQAPVKYIDITESKAKQIFNEHIRNGKVVTDYALAIGSEQTL